MATLTFPQEEKVVNDPQEISRFLAGVGIWYSQFEGTDSLPEDAGDAEILATYKAPIQKLMAEGGYVTVDVINVKPTTPGLDAMLNRFSKEHWHDEDEVRFIVHGRGLFHVHPPDGQTFSLEVVKGDMIRVPRGTHHWFDLCSDKTIRAIRLFQDQSGWTPHYTESGEDTKFQPLCFGPSYIPTQGF
ncbi:MAG TPA: cupin domain-containing protein [Thermoanaerobaculia bacterium]|nr:cupin domain-containing protein [Thermoanaerobaculia bacterium]